jgi:diguanylate cyclase (GGDEF)-like protein
MNARPFSSWWARRTLRAKVVLAAALPLTVLGAVVPANLMAVRATERMGEEIERIFQIRGAVATVRRDLLDAETNVRGYLLTGDARFLHPYRAAAASAGGDFVRLRDRLLEAGAGEAPHMETLDRLIVSRLDMLRRLVAFRQANPDPGAIPESLLSQGKRISDQIRATLDDLDASMGVLLTRDRDRLRGARNLAMLLYVVIGPLLLLATIMAALAVAGGLVRRIGRLERTARRIETGEALEDADRGADELSRLDGTLRATAARLAQQDAALRELALVDPLTGLRNRRGFLEIAEHELQVCLRRGSATALLFIDVDGLKEVNDAHGHAVGDALLRDVADVLRSTTRESDLLSRVGGDEFCVLLTRDSALDGTVLLDRLATTTEAWNAREGVPYWVAFSLHAPA